MKLALKEAKKAYLKNEVPIGAVIVKDDKIIARGHNLREKTNLATSHAEVNAINKACKKLKSWRLDNCDIYITLEPCIMCTGTIIQSRISNVYIGALDPKNGMIVSKGNLFDLDTTHKVNYEIGILKEECSSIIKEFFKELRENKK